MTTFITPEHLNHLKFNLGNPSSINLPSSSYRIEDDVDAYNDYWFQILVYETPEDPSVKPNLVFGKKKDLLAQYNLSESSLPTSGVSVDPEFVKDGDPKYASSIAYLLQARKLSQTLAYTWLKPEDIEDEEIRFQVGLIRTILDTFSIAPKEKIVGSDDVSEIALERELLSIKEAGYDSFLIKPGSIGYDSIKLPLLFSGQAYYKKDDNYRRICDSIISTCDSVNQYSMNISWNTFYASVEDLPASGRSPNPPYTQMTLGYPPKPNEFNLNDKQIKDWATATEYYGDSTFPFYPEKNTSEWRNQQVEYVVPPYPYMPLTSW
jgi:hypothetical protein